MQVCLKTAGTQARARTHIHTHTHTQTNYNVRELMRMRKLYYMCI